MYPSRNRSISTIESTRGSRDSRSPTKIAIFKSMAKNRPLQKTLMSLNFVANNFFVTSRRYRRILHQNLLRFYIFSAKTTGWIASYVIFSMRIAYLCPVRLFGKSSPDTNRITLRGTFSTSHLWLNFGPAVNRQPVTAPGDS